MSINDLSQDIRLNQGQKAAAEGFFGFLFSNEKMIILSGPGGVGKTFLMGYLIDRVMPEYFKTCRMMGIQPEYDDVVMTATTNKAAEVLGLATNRPTATIHSFLNLRVENDYSTGKSKLSRTRNWRVHERKIIFIDECSMVDTPLFQMLIEGTHNCKIVFVGDHSQLAPVTETISPVYTLGLPFYELTEPMRNAGQPALMQLCSQLRHTVATGEFLPIQIVPGVIDHLNDTEMEQAINHTFSQQNREARILAYTNQRVVTYNDHIRTVRGLSDQYGIGELLVNNSPIRFDKRTLSVEEEVEITDQDLSPDTFHVDSGVLIQVRYAQLKSRLGMIYDGVPIPLDRDHVTALLRYYGQKKDWRTYFRIRDSIPDLRPRDAATVHKSQGSTYDTVFVDLGNLSTCHQPNVVSRLLYVAFSRARHRVVLYGELAGKYGGLIT